MAICVECGIRAPEAFGPYTKEDSCLCLECVKKLDITWCPEVQPETYLIIPKRQVDDPVVQELRRTWPRGHAGDLCVITALPDKPAEATLEEETVCEGCGDDLDPDGCHLSGKDCGYDKSAFELRIED